MFGPSPIGSATTASADICRPIPTLYSAGSAPLFEKIGAGRQTSQGKTRDLRAKYLSHLRPPLPGCIGLRAYWPSRPGADASYALAVRQAGTLLTASFRSRIAPGTLAVRLAVPTPRARRGLPPPSHRPDTTPANRCLRHHAPCLAHQKTAAPLRERPSMNVRLDLRAFRSDQRRRSRSRSMSRRPRPSSTHTLWQCRPRRSHTVL